MTTEIAGLLDLELGELYEKAGEELLGEGAFVSPKTRESIRLAGKRWVDNNKARLVQLICKNENIIKLYNKMEDPKGEKKILLVTAIADLIAGVCIGVSPVTVAALLTKEGINKLCPNIGN